MISVCLASFNGAPYIERQLVSIIGQLTGDDEIIVSDDGSTDGTLDVVRQLQKATPIAIHILHNGEPHGYTRNFENALRQAKGDYIFISDQDDVWLPNKIASMVLRLRQPGNMMVISNAMIADAALNVTHPDYFAVRGIHRSLLGNLVKFGFLGCCMALRREVLHRALPFPEDQHLCTHDNWLYLCAAISGRVIVLDTPLMYYRRHDGVTTTGALNAHKPLSFRLRYRFYLLWHLMRRFL